MRGVITSEDEVLRSMSSMISDIPLNSVTSLSAVTNALGASIFVPANTILLQAARDFGLEVESLDITYGEDDDAGLGMFLQPLLSWLMAVGTGHNSSLCKSDMRITIGVS